MGGGYSFDGNDRDILIYNRRQGVWSHLPTCLAKWFGMVQFKGRLLTVGGKDASGFPLAVVFTLSPDCRRWEEFIPPMPTARYNPSVITTTTAVVAAGGCIEHMMRVLKVEVYNDDASQWYSSDPLPKLQGALVTEVIDDFCYILDSSYRKFYKANLVSLIHKATSPSPSLAASKSLWERLSPTPLNNCSLVSLKGSLMAVGGSVADGFLGGTNVSPAVFIFINNTWVRLKNGDMPVPRKSCSSGQLSSDEVIVIGGLGHNSGHLLGSFEGLYAQLLGGDGSVPSRYLHDVYIGTL